jgi:hypothetical protein
MERLHPSMSLNNENIFVKLVNIKKQFVRSTVREVFGFELSVFESLVPVKIFQFQDMGKENRFLGTFRSHSKWPKWYIWRNTTLHACIEELYLHWGL